LDIVRLTNVTSKKDQIQSQFPPLNIIVSFDVYKIVNSIQWYWQTWSTSKNDIKRIGKLHCCSHTTSGILLSTKSKLLKLTVPDVIPMNGPFPILFMILLFIWRTVLVSKSEISHRLWHHHLGNIGVWWQYIKTPTLKYIFLVWKQNIIKRNEKKIHPSIIWKSLILTYGALFLTTVLFSVVVVKLTTKIASPPVVEKSPTFYWNVFWTGEWTVPSSRYLEKENCVDKRTEEAMLIVRRNINVLMTMNFVVVTGTIR
jgi:hypothetical protein